MKITEKYYLCDMCSKIVKKEKMSSITQIFDGNSGKSYLVKDIELSRISSLFNYDDAESNNLLKKYIDILHFCPECSDFIRNKNRTSLLCLDNLSVSCMSKKSHGTIDYILSRIIKRKVSLYDCILSRIIRGKVSLCDSTIFPVMATVIDDSLQKKLSFAKAKNNKLAEVYFASVDIQIKEMLEEEKTEE